MTDEFEPLGRGGGPPPPQPDGDGGGGGGGGGEGPPGGDIILGDGGGGGGDSSGSSSGGSSSSGGGTVTRSVSPQEVREQKMIASFEQVYFKLWGVLPSPDYAKKFVKQGMNIFEFEEFERHKPAFRKTETYRGEADRFAQYLRQLGVI